MKCVKPNRSAFNEKKKEFTLVLKMLVVLKILADMVVIVVILKQSVPTVGQLSSSDASTHCCFPSQRNFNGMQKPSPQVKSNSGQFSRTHKQAVSSAPREWNAELASNMAERPKLILSDVPFVE